MRLAAMIVGLFLALSTPAFAADAPKSTPVTLPSGKQVTIISVTQGHWGKEPVIMLNYRSQLPLDNNLALRQEADEIWDRFVSDAEHGGFQSAVISAHGAAAELNEKTYNFIYEKKAAWHAHEPDVTRLDEKLVRDLFARVDFQNDHKAINAFLLYIADDWKGVVPDDKGKPQKLDRTQMAKMAYDVMQQTTDYRHERAIQSITIAPDGLSAEVVSREVDAGKVNGAPFQVTHMSYDSVALKNNFLLFTRYRSEDVK